MSNQKLGFAKLPWQWPDRFMEELQRMIGRDGFRILQRTTEMVPPVRIVNN